MAKWSIRLTSQQTFVVWHHAKKLPNPWLAGLMYANIYTSMTINLTKLTPEQVADLETVLELASSPVFGNKRSNITKRALRKRLKIVTEFSELSAIDRLAEVGHRSVRRRCQCYPLCDPPCGAPRG